MNILNAIVAVLERHREARKWSDHAVATSLVTELGLDPEAEHAGAVVALVTEDQVAAADAVAKTAADDAAALRAKKEEQEAPARRADAQRAETEHAAEPKVVASFVVPVPAMPAAIVEHQTANAPAEPYEE